MLNNIWTTFKLLTIKLVLYSTRFLNIIPKHDWWKNWLKNMSGQYTKLRILQLKTVNSYYENNLTPQNGCTFFLSKFKINDLIIGYRIFWIYFFVFQVKTIYKTSIAFSQGYPLKPTTFSLEIYQTLRVCNLLIQKPLNFLNTLSTFFWRFLLLFIPKHYKMRSGCQWLLWQQQKDSERNSSQHACMWFHSI